MALAVNVFLSAFAVRFSPEPSLCRHIIGFIRGNAGSKRFVIIRSLYTGICAPITSKESAGRIPRFAAIAVDVEIVSNLMTEVFPSRDSHPSDSSEVIEEEQPASK